MLQTLDRKSTRLNSSHRCISYAVFCLKRELDHSLTISHQNRPRHDHFRLSGIAASLAKPWRCKADVRGADLRDTDLRDSFFFESIAAPTTCCSAQHPGSTA